MVSEKIPPADRAVGVPEDKQQELEEAMARVYENRGNAKIEGIETEKSQRDLEIINFVIGATSDYQKRYGRKKDIPVPLEKIHILEDGGTEKFTKDRLSKGAHATTYGSILADRKESDIDFALIIFHELFHLKSYKALQITKAEKPENGELGVYRSGISVTTRDGEKVYFEDLEEAIITIVTERFYKEYILTSDLFKDEVESKAPEFSRSREREKLEKLVEELWQRNQDKFQDKDEVLDLFIDAQINGNLLKVGRLIEKTFGKGIFRKIGEYDFSDN